MDGQSIGLIISMAVLVLLSGFFSASETAFSSLNRIRIKNLAENGSRSAKRVLRLSEDYDKLLSTILVGNNIVNISLASIGTIFFVNMLKLTGGATVSTVVITVVVLIFGEVTPKSIAKDHAEGYALATSSVLQLLIWIFTPVNFLFSLWKKLISKIFKTSEEKGMTGDELLTIVDEACEDGSLDEQESELIRSAIEFDQREVVDIFTPRVDVVAVEYNSTKEDIQKVFFDSDYSRLPVYKESVDNIVGIINEKDFHKQVLFGKKSAKSIIKPVAFIPESMKIDDLLRELQKTKIHMAVVLDEYGGTAGIVTLEDVLEELVGEIWDEHDEVVEEVKEYKDGRQRILCSMALDEFLEHFGIEDDCDASTVSGWVMEHLDKIPDKGDKFEYSGLAVSVTKVDQRRAEEIVIKILEKPEEEE